VAAETILQSFYNNGTDLFLADALNKKLINLKQIPSIDSTTIDVFLDYFNPKLGMTIKNISMSQRMNQALN